MKIPARAQSLADRALSTAAQSALAYLGSAVALDALTLDYRALAGVALGGALFSFLTNVARSGLSGRLSKED